MSIEHRGMLIHVSHYDPAWCAAKLVEEPFDLDTATELLPKLADCGMNLLVVDIADGVIYNTHPEMRKPYSVPIEQMRILADRAREHGIDVAPKLNFAKSGRCRHDLWMKPYANNDQWLDGVEEYFRVAGELIAELVETMKPAKFFHLGMDEDHYRSVPQYVDAIHRLREHVVAHGLRAIIWNDSAHDDPAEICQVHAHKSIAAEPHLEKDIVHVLWHYGRPDAEAVRRLSDAGFEVWAAPGWDSPEQVRQWRDVLEANGGSGLLMTRWRKCNPAFGDLLHQVIEVCGPAYRS